MNYSYSAISSFRSCPKSFEFRYIRKARESFVSVERYMGSCVHEVLHWAYTQRLENGIPEIREVEEEYGNRWQQGELTRVRVIKKDTALEDYFGTGMRLLSGFFQDVFPRDKSETLHLEHHFQLSLDNDVSYRGIIDRLSRQPGGVIRITDFKTGTVSHPLDNFQLPSYALHVFQQHPDEAAIELCLEDLATPRTIVARFERERAEKVRAEIGREIEAIDRATGFPAKPGVLCRWCGYNDVCREGREALGETDRPIASSAVAAPEPSPGTGEPQYCPQCGSPLRKREGKFGAFWGCSHFPECRYTLDIRESEGVAKPGTAAEEICPECGGMLRKRKGKFGAFWGCSHYPECRFTRKMK